MIQWIIFSEERAAAPESPLVGPQAEILLPKKMM